MMTNNFKSLRLFILQLRGPRPAFQGAAGPLLPVLRVGRALLLAERAGGVLPLQQHRQGEDRLSEGPRAVRQGERATPRLAVCAFVFSFSLSRIQTASTLNYQSNQR